MFNGHKTFFKQISKKDFFGQVQTDILKCYILNRK